MAQKITTIFTDIGGVLLTNGWDHVSREIGIEKFKLVAAEINERHHLVYDTFESGNMPLDEYLDYTVFYEPRNFSKEDFINYMYSCSQPYHEMLDLMRYYKKQYGVKIIALSNEGREVNEHRINAFKLNEFIDCFVSSCYVHLRKPDEAIFKLAIDIVQTPLEHCIYIDDRSVLVQVAARYGLNGIVHENYETTKQQLDALICH
ncbi:MAG: HAD family phosphatase [Chitinophagaceae bacterium]|nr:MAG: HAD family phosphatase [Chitinophagaceae bacterium]